MAGDPASDDPGGMRLQGSVSEWLSTTAADWGISEEVLLRRLLEAYDGIEAEQFETEEDLSEVVDEVRAGEADERIEDAIESMMASPSTGDGAFMPSETTSEEGSEMVFDDPDEVVVENPEEGAETRTDTNEGSGKVFGRDKRIAEEISVDEEVFETESLEDADVAERIDKLERKLDSMIEDVRMRVVQVKREADAKAPEDHAHEELQAEVDQLAAEVESFWETIERTDEGFENYEEVIDYLMDTVEEMETKLDTLARRVAEFRELGGDLAEHLSDQEAVDRITGEANKAGIRRAPCESCNNSVDVGLLNEPRCPHCDARFSEFEPYGGFLRSNIGFLNSGVIRTRTPAIEGEVAEEDEVAGEEP